MINLRKITKRDIRIKYLPDEVGNMIRYLPLVHIILTHKKTCIYTVALIDSGATSTFIPSNFAKKIRDNVN